MAAKWGTGTLSNFKSNEYLKSSKIEMKPMICIQYHENRPNLAESFLNSIQIALSIISLPYIEMESDTKTLREIRPSKIEPSKLNYFF